MDMKKLLEAIDSMQTAAKQSNGPKFTGYWKGNDKRTPSDKMVGGDEEQEESVKPGMMKELSKVVTEKSKEWELAEAYQEFLTQIEEENIGTHPKRAGRKSDRHARGHEPQPRYKKVKANEGWNTDSDRVSLPDSPHTYWSGTGALQKEYEALYNKLVPSQGAADTIEGEVLRAASKIVYRHYNDGDEFNEASFDQLEQYIGKVTSYDDLAHKSTEFAVKANGNYHPNQGWDSLDVMDYGPPEDDYDDEDDYGDDGWPDDEDDLEEGEHDAEFIDHEDSFYNMAEYAHKQMAKGKSLQDVVKYLRDNKYLGALEVNSFVKQVRGEKWNESVEEAKHFRTAYGWAGGRNEKTGGTYKHPDQIKADREAKKALKAQQSNDAMNSMFGGNSADLTKNLAVRKDEGMEEFAKAQAAKRAAARKEKSQTKEGAEQDPIVAKVVKQMRPGLKNLDMGNEAFLYFAYELGKQRARDAWEDYLPAIRAEYEKGLNESYDQPKIEYKGFKYETEPLEDEDTRKILHYVVSPSGKRADIDWSSWDYMTQQDFERWLHAGMPSRKDVGSIGPLNSEALDKLTNVAESRGHTVIANKLKDIERAKKFANGELTIPTPQERRAQLEKPKKEKVDEYGATSQPVPGSAGATGLPDISKMTPQQKAEVAKQLDPNAQKNATAAATQLKAATGSSATPDKLLKAISAADQGKAVSPQDMTALKPVMDIVQKAATEPKLASQFKSLASQARTIK